MKRLLLIIALIPVLSVAQSRKQRKAEEKNDKATLANLQAHVQYLAGDQLEGRRTGTAGEKLAAEYIIKQFTAKGLSPKGTNGFLQEFGIDEGKKFADTIANSMIVNGARLALKKEFYPLAFSSNGTASGTAAPDLREKGAPWFFDVNDLLEENTGNPHFDMNRALQQEALTVKEKGATALIIYNSGALVDNIQFNRYDSSTAASIPVIYITKEGYQHYFADGTAMYDISLGVQITHEKRTATNIVGYLNYNAPTTVILGAHYDHLGFGEDGNALDGPGQIHNGADDNASGTAALIELAGRLQKIKAQNNNYLFIAFSGEELGLFGSKYWLDHPSVNIVPNYMINMDMVGRYDSSRKLTVGGFGTSPTWSEVLSTTTPKTLVIKTDSSGSGPSDHASFYRKNIPVLFFFTNSHPDYHKATDDWDKINYSGELEIVKYIEKIINATNTKGKLAFLKTRDQEMRAVAMPVTLGVIPDYGYTGTGMRIDGVSKGKLAERLGLQGGDILLQLGDYKFVDVQTYMQSLQHFKKGDSTTLRIKRGDKEMTLDLTF